MTRTILTMPIKGTRKTVIGVMQVINKRNGEPFNDGDEKLMRSFLTIAGPLIEGSQMYQMNAKRSGSELSGDSAAGARATIAAPAIHEEEEEEGDS